MALIFNEANENYLASGLGTTWVDYSGAGTLCFWAKKTTGASTGASYGCPLAFSAAAARSNEFCINQNGSTQWAYNTGGSGPDMFAWTNDLWTFFAFGKANDGTDKSVYYGTGTISSLTEISGVTGMNYAFDRITLGTTCNNDYTFTQFEGKVARIRLFNARLTDAEILAEAQNAAVQKTANCVFDWPLIETLNANTGAVNFSAVAGTATFDTDDPYPASSSVAPLAMSAYSRMRNG